MVTGRQTPLQQLRLQWLVLFALALAMLAGVASSRFALSLGNRTFDTLMAWQARTPGNDIVIIAVDDDTLDALGGWPLSRTHYSRLLQQLDDPQCRPKAIGIDLHFYDATAHDAELARRMAALPVVLPMEFRRNADTEDQADTVEFKTAIPPMQASAAFGHINMYFDVDGVVRKVQLYDRQWPHFSLRMVQTAAGLPAKADTTVPGLGGADTFRRFAIPAIGNSYAVLPLFEALQAGCSATLFKDKFVLLGVTAPSLGDRLPTVNSVADNTSTPGVEILASILDGIQSGTLVSDAPGSWLGISSFATVVVFMLSFLLLPLRRVLVVAVLVELAWFGSCGWLLYERHIWLNPIPAALVILAAAFGWALLRHESIVQFVRHKSRDLQQGSNTQRPREPLPANHSVVGHYQELSQAVSSMQHELAFLSVLINEMPEAVVVYNHSDELLLGNRHIHSLFEPGILAPGAGLGLILRKLQLTMDQLHATGSMHVFDVHTLPGQRDFSLKTSVIQGPGGTPMRLLFLADVTELRKHQIQRDRTLRFLSHDMRTPIAAIMSLVRLNGSKAGNQEAPALLPQILHQAKTLLQMADDFTFTVSAEIGNFRFKEELLETLLNDALEQVMPLAHAKAQTIEEVSPRETVFVAVDTRLFLRALVNVLANAIKFAPEGSRIAVKSSIFVDSDPGAPLWPNPLNMGGNTEHKVRITITNTIEAKPEKTEYSRYLSGFGIGLDFVDNVLKKHGGNLHRYIPKTGSANINLTLPCTVQTEDLA